MRGLTLPKWLHKRSKQPDKATVIPLDWCRGTETIPADVLYLRVMVNGVGLNFILDTGASATIIDDDAFKYLFNENNLTQHPVITASGRTTARGISTELHMGDISCKCSMGIMSLDAICKNITYPLAIHGILGMNVLDHFNGIIDIKKQQLTLHEPQK